MKTLNFSFKFLRARQRKGQAGIKPAAPGAGTRALEMEKRSPGENRRLESAPFNFQSSTCSLEPSYVPMRVRPFKVQGSRFKIRAALL
jgi:hypothetical protein